MLGSVASSNNLRSHGRSGTTSRPIFPNTGDAALLLLFFLFFCTAAPNCRGWGVTANHTHNVTSIEAPEEISSRKTISGSIWCGNTRRGRKCQSPNISRIFFFSAYVVHRSVRRRKDEK
jgi:hypothetical protein